jgi:predicted porin
MTRTISRHAKVALASLATLAFAPVGALEYDFYGSLRVHGEAVDPNGSDEDGYSGWRDAYSRIGVRASHALNDGVTAYGTFELPIDVPNKAIQDPWDQDEDIRVAQVGIKGAYGDLSVGQMWLPYYNAIAYPVDMFSSYYSGFATYTAFRRGDTVAYYSPTFAGLSGALGYSHENGAADADGDPDDRFQATLSYTVNGITLAGGLDDLGGADDAKIWGASLMWQATDDLYIGAKYEQHDSDLDSGYGADGDTAVNLYAGYTIGKTTLKGMVARVDGYGEDVYHLGVDYQVNNALKLFAEYYSEDEAAAITTRRDGGFCGPCEGGSVITAGLRYDFGAP